MKTTTVEKLSKEDRFSYGIKVTCFDNNIETDKFIIPVVDVRDGKEQRDRVKQMTKGGGSKYLQPSFSVVGNSYQTSHKNQSLKAAD